MQHWQRQYGERRAGFSSSIRPEATPQEITRTYLHHWRGITTGELEHMLKDARSRGDLRTAHAIEQEIRRRIRVGIGYATWTNGGGS